jgi:hypothetical protein
VEKRGGEFWNRLGGRIRTRDRAAVALLSAVSRAWPGYVRIEGNGRVALQLMAAGMIDVRTVAPRAGSVGKMPLASPLARLQAGRGEALTSLHHVEIRPGSESFRVVLGLADGTRTRAGLIRDLRSYYPAETRERRAFAVDQHLLEMEQYGLLMAD